MPIHPIFLAAKNLLLLLCITFLLMAPEARAQALPKPSNVNRAVSGALQDSMRGRGFAANDPRFGNTLARISPVLSGVAGTTAAAVTIGAVTAPAWASVALAAGIGAVVTYAVTLAIDGAVQWIFGDSSIDVNAGPTNIEGVGIALGGAYWSAGSPRGTIYGGDGISVARQSYSEFAAQYGVTASPICSINGGIAACLASEPDAIGSYLSRQALYYSNGSPASCLPGHFSLNNGCIPYTATPGQDLDDATPQRAIEALPAGQLDKPLNPAIIAALANRAWQQAASQPGYDGLPYPQSNPITQAEVQPWLQANPEYVPTVRDFVSPNPVTEAAPNPWALPSNPTAANPVPSTPNTGTTNPAKDNPQANLGPDPGIGAPTLEPIPTAQQIANPILQLAPDLRGFKASGQSGVCPRPTIELYGTHVLDAHCKLIDDNKQVLQLAMAFAWAAMALFIVLSA
jgi:hypothetical protein